MWRLYHFLDIFECFGSILARFASLILCIYVCIDLFGVNVVHTHARAIVSHDLRLEAELSMAHRAHKVGLSLPGGFFLLGQAESRGLDGFRVDNLSGREVLEDVILNLEQVDGQFFVQRLSEFLREVDQEVQHVVLFISQ